MIIELRGVEFVNKGAELMMQAIIKKIREKFPEAILTMQIGAKTPKAKLLQNGIKIKFSSNRSNRIGAFIPGLIRRIAGYYLESEVNIVLDGSGFAFGDQWGATYASRRLGSKISKWHNEGKKVILLPQAFGPFNAAELKMVMKKIILNADLLFAREEESYRHLQNIATFQNIKQSPDFTNLINGKVPEGFDSETYQVAIIPNYKIVESKSANQDVYISFLKHAIDKTIAIGLKPYFLIHEGVKDHQVAKDVNSFLTQPLDIIVMEDPLEIKGIISTAKFIVCSRFHGVVSALSQGVPCVTTSWSHKYVMLLKEYDFHEGLVQDLINYETLNTLLFNLAQPSYRYQLCEKLLQKSKVQKEKSAQMWDEVFNVINNYKKHR
ncbi:polysaccharide pyruvyl transferase family protein [Mucilaginibacter psychrotolerans]|nr:polysaccharide pyruvyl transferase family protein [Mucilaginibacter psychrotolerans]